MDLDRLETFLLLAELKSFTEVAQQLFISQPAVSKQLKSLEKELGVPLFNRVGQKNYLTIQGKSFVQYAKSILNTYAIAKEHILQIENIEEGNIRFGATNFIGVYLLPRLISEFRNEFPSIELNFKISSSSKLLKEFDKESIEFAFMSGYVDFPKETFTKRKIFEDELQVIVSSKHILSDRTSISLSEIQDETFILKDSTSSLNKFLLERIGDNFLDSKNILTISNQEGIKEAVVQNLGISFLSTRAIKYELELGHLKALTLKDYNLKRDINLVYKNTHALTPAAEAFINVIDNPTHD